MSVARPAAGRRRVALRAVVAAALAAVFAAYLQPGVMLDVASRLWSCF